MLYYVSAIYILAEELFITDAFYTLEYKDSLLSSTVPQRKFKLESFHSTKRSLKGYLNYYNALHTKKTMVIFIIVH